MNRLQLDLDVQQITKIPVDKRTKEQKERIDSYWVDKNRLVDIQKAEELLRRERKIIYTRLGITC